MYPKTTQSLYDPKHEHDACGVGFVANINGQREHRILAYALQALGNLAHRGALDADASTGDGSGVLTQLPHTLLGREVEKLGGKLRKDSDLAVGMVFMSKGKRYQTRSRRILEAAAIEFGLHIFGWRTVPVNLGALGDKAGNTLPEIQQILVGRPERCNDMEFERQLFLVRKTAERRVCDEKIPGFYIPSFSSRTIVYKGLFNAPQLAKFYPDLENPLYAPRSRFFTSAIRPTRFRTGNWRIPSGCWPTMAKSTRCPVTKSGLAPASRN